MKQLFWLCIFEQDAQFHKQVCAIFMLTLTDVSVLDLIRNFYGVVFF